MASPHKGTKTSAMSAEVFKRKIANVLGEGAERKLATAIGKDYTTVFRWANGHVEVPTYAIAIVELLEKLPAAFRPKRWL